MAKIDLTKGLGGTITEKPAPYFTPEQQAEYFISLLKDVSKAAD